jgi:serine/threonine protein kinase
MATVQPLAKQFELAHVLVIDVGKTPPLSSPQRHALFDEVRNRLRSTHDFANAEIKKRAVFLHGEDAVEVLFLGDPELPLRCAMELNHSMRGSVSLPLRMGLHSWPIGRATDLHLTRNIGEAGIKVAHNIMDYGGSCHILVSEFVADLLRQLGQWNDALHDLGEVEVSQGLKLRLFNFCNEQAGNPQPPDRMRAVTKPQGNVLQLDPMLDRTVSHYRILRRLGTGGMGVVYEAEDMRLGRHVAVKLLTEKFSRSSTAIERFRREACTASSLNHPNICTIHDTGEYDGRQFIVMELLEGCNLRQFIAAGPLPLEKIVSIGTQIAAGLDAAHRQSIVHRDIKPANLFVVQQDRIKILDFGLAKPTSADRTERFYGTTTLDSSQTTRQDVTAPGEFIGTVSYMSPEQARGELLDRRTDLFSFGVVLYEMATGLLPFRGDTSAVVFDAILNRNPAPAIRVNPRLSPELDQIIERALEKRRDLRYQSAADMAAELRRLSIRINRVAEIAAAPVAAEAQQIVILHKRNAQPDEQVMHALEEKLIRLGHRVFVDRHLVVGVEWAREIEQQITSAQAVIPLLSTASVDSEMLAYEIELAHSFGERQGGKPRILPVRVAFNAELPDSLHSALDGLHCAFWSGSDDNDRVLEDVAKALQAPPESFRRKPNLEPVGGALPLESKFYIVRPTDQEFYSAIARNDSIVLLKGARQMGKTSLMARGLQQARKAGAKVVLTDFQKLNSAHLQSVESLFVCLGQAIAEQLDLEALPEETWNARRGPSMNFERFFRREILGHIEGRLVWGMDEVDRLFACPFGSEVFGLFRSWHNERSLDPTGPWHRLSLAIAYASEAHLFITDVNQSPFNVGTRLVLADFTLDQVRELNQRYGSPLCSEDEIEHFYSLLGGQPFLTQRGLHQMTEKGLSFSEFSAGAGRDEGPYGDHLRRIFVSLNQDASLCEVVRAVIAGRHSSATDSFYRLRSSGIVAGESARDMKLRCQLYEQYLSRHLL